MPSHPLVTQLRFARSEFLRCLDGVSSEDAVHRFELSWPEKLIRLAISPSEAMTLWGDIRADS